MKKSFALIGPGRVGSAISRHLFADGFQIKAVIGRDMERSRAACNFIGCTEELATTEFSKAEQAQIILLAVPDDKITEVAVRLAEYCSLVDKILIHFSGLKSSSALYPSAIPTTQALSLHPLFPFADAQQAYSNLLHCPCALEGGHAAIEIGRQIVASFQGQPFEISAANKPLYHAAASIASNFLVTLFSLSRDLLRRCQIEEAQLTPILIPLIKATITNLETFPPEQGLTGPIVRGDLGTVEQHLRSLYDCAPETLGIYQVLARQTLSLAEKSGRLEAPQANQLRTVIDNTATSAPDSR